jgi:hypothetical protein
VSGNHSPIDGDLLNGTATVGAENGDEVGLSADGSPNMGNVNSKFREEEIGAMGLTNALNSIGEPFPRIR